MSLLLEGKRAFITGGTRGIGAALCEVFAREGADVAFNYHTSDERASTTVAKVTAHGRRSLAYKIPITDRVALKRMTRELVEAWGGVDILVNNAGRSIRRSVKASYDRFHDYERTMQLNYFGAIRMITALIPAPVMAKEEPAPVEIHPI